MNNTVFTLQEAEEALSLAVREGHIPPHRANEMSETDVMGWFERGMQEEQTEEIL